MDTKEFFNAKVLKKFIKGSMVLIGLFAVLYYIVVALVLLSGDKFRGSACTLFLVLLIPVTVFPIFLYLLNNIINESIIKTNKIEISDEVCNMMAKIIIKTDSDKDKEELKKLLNGSSMVLLFTKPKA